MGLILFILFVSVPIIEIALFIKIGGAIGLFPTLAVVILTALVGSALLRIQGFATLSRARQDMEDGQIPIDQVVHGLFLLVAGVLLLTPGFFTDAVGFALFFPPLRLALGQKIVNAFMSSGRVHMETHVYPGSRGRPTDNTVIDGEAVEVPGEER